VSVEPGPVSGSSGMPTPAIRWEGTVRTEWVPGTAVSEYQVAVARLSRPGACMVFFGGAALSSAPSAHRQPMPPTTARTRSAPNQHRRQHGRALPGQAGAKPFRRTTTQSPATCHARGHHAPVLAIACGINARLASGVSCLSSLSSAFAGRVMLVIAPPRQAEDMRGKSTSCTWHGCSCSSGGNSEAGSPAAMHSGFFAAPRVLNWPHAITADADIPERGPRVS
jgi:hypothetical protein